ncbi:BZ3500_MvSof-1268-A1-R1_Chr1-1g01252 [Microbotryum saponariae]|uniref:BZ3500_MvSof-1268-A1-R1_Chr1-1g01252 protein n=1 Tax=Microbotryum saponariae TaxID=289078 RepID=A0A2X0L4X1_9BASI|nr:BZ3500_MvSof-1268-A1-R1_Chr1-1g01252 [Microbotryum saponariae]SCZ93791.1 BZ3501_MvSof-1269-A2-R1_Chr1-1g00848 [Microbotryum saponariae]
MSDSEFKDCLAKHCDFGEEGLDDCYRLDQATACVRQRCPPGPHFDYLDVS